MRSHVALRPWSDAAPLLLHRDAPNEWFYDPDAGELYWFYNATGAPPALTKLASYVWGGAGGWRSKRFP